MGRIDTVSEVILYARDMDRLVSFYRDEMGLEVADGAPEHGFVRFDTGGCDLCLHAGAEGEVGPAAPKVVFAADDLEAARDRLRDRGVDLGEIRSPAPGVRVCDGTDPEGNAFSIESAGEAD